MKIQIKNKMKEVLFIGNLDDNLNMLYEQIKEIENNELEDNSVKELAKRMMVSESEFQAHFATTDIDKNYSGQDEAALFYIRDEIGKAERELFTKWNLKSGIYVNEIYGNIFDGLVEFTDIYDKATDISEITEEVVSSAKNTCIENFNSLLEDYAKEYDIGEKLLNEVKNDVPEIIGKYFDEAVSKICNNETRNKLEELYNTCNEAYEAKDYDKMNQASDTILEYCKSSNTFYRDKALMEKLEDITMKNEYIQNKIKNGLDPEITGYEKELLNKFYNHPW